MLGCLSLEDARALDSIELVRAVLIHMGRWLKATVAAIASIHLLRRIVVLILCLLEAWVGRAAHGASVLQGQFVTRE